MKRAELKRVISRLPDDPGIYMFKDREDAVLYVGKADQLKTRVRSYFAPPDSLHPRTRQLVERIHSIETIGTTGRREALVLEASLIREHNPKYNVTLKTSARYPYVCLSGDPFPRIIITRVPDHVPGSCYGPYTDVKSLRELLKQLKTALPLRSCGDRELARRTRPCILYNMNRCIAPCIHDDVHDEYSELVRRAKNILRGKVSGVIRDVKAQMNRAAEELRFEDAVVLRDQIKALEKLAEKQRVVMRRKRNLDVIGLAVGADLAAILLQQIREGKVIGHKIFFAEGIDQSRSDSALLSSILVQLYMDSQDLPARILLPAQPEDGGTFEEWFAGHPNGPVHFQVPRSGIGKDLVSWACTNAVKALEEELAKKHRWNERVPEGVIRLGRILDLPSIPRTICGMDISNLSGRETVGSVVVFRDGIPSKRDYRRYRLTGETPDDTGMLREMAARWARRVENGELDKPDLLMVDGGVGQLNAVAETLREHDLLESIYLVSLAKRDEVINRLTQPTEIMLSRHDAALQMLQRVRDEAHRFAITYHRKIRKKRLVKSELESIPGVGKKRARMLLLRFKGIQGLRSASLDDIVSSPGIGKNLGAEIKRFLEGS